MKRHSLCALTEEPAAENSEGVDVEVSQVTQVETLARKARDSARRGNVTCRMFDQWGGVLCQMIVVSKKLQVYGVY